MPPPADHVVTGAFSFTGAHVARALLARGERVRTLSRRPDPSHPLASDVGFGRLQFTDEDALRRDLSGAATLFNTYWVRFPRGETTWASVIENTRTLLRAARDAGVGRVVQFSVTNAAADSPYGYFRAKALAEQALREAGLSYAIVRPTLIFGSGELLLSNIAWALRRSPVFLVPSDGDYPTQPVSTKDVAALAVELADLTVDAELDAAGPTVYTFSELVGAVRAAIGVRRRIVSCPPLVVAATAGVVSTVLRDVLVLREELAALRDGLLVAGSGATGTQRLEDWLGEEGDQLGRAFVRELRRNWY